MVGFGTSWDSISFKV